MQSHVGKCFNSTSKFCMNDLKQVFYTLEDGSNETLYHWFTNNKWFNRLPYLPCGASSSNATDLEIPDKKNVFQCPLCLECFSKNRICKDHLRSIHMNDSVEANTGDKIRGVPMKLKNKHIRIKMNYDTWISIFLQEVSKTSIINVPYISAAVTTSNVISAVFKNYKATLKNISKFAAQADDSSSNLEKDFNYYQLQATITINLISPIAIVRFKNNLFPEPYANFLSKLGINLVTSFGGAYYSVEDENVIKRNIKLLENSKNMSITPDDISDFYTYSMDLVQQSDIFTRNKCGMITKLIFYVTFSGKLLSDNIFQHEAFNMFSKKVNDFLSDWKKSTAKMYSPYLFRFFSFVENYCSMANVDTIFQDDVYSCADGVAKIHAIVCR